MKFLSKKHTPALLALVWGLAAFASTAAHAQGPGQMPEQTPAPTSDRAPDAAQEPIQAQAASDQTDVTIQAPGAPGAQPSESAPEASSESAAPAPDRARPVCVWGRPRTQCKSSPLLEFSFFFPRDIDYNGLMFSFDGGWLFSRPGKHALGATVGAICNPDCNFSIKGRYRYYLARWASVDISPGVYTGATRGLQLEAALQLSDFIAVTGGFTTTSSDNGFETGKATFVGVRMGLPLMLVLLAFGGS